MALKNSIAENIILPLSDLITGQSVASNFKFLQRSQWWSREQIDSYQNERLKSLIRHSYHTVPYYKELFDSLNIKPEDISNKNDLLKLPVLTKEIIKKEGIERFTSFQAKKRVSNSSSGSTGEPLFYYTTKDAYSLNIAANLRGWYWMGFRLGDKYIKLSQNPRKKVIKRLQDKLSYNLYLATSPLINENFKTILEQIESYKPKIIRCYPDPLLFLARYKKLNQGFKYSPLAITTTGNTLFPETRKEIEDTFGCKIFDAYSCEGNSNVFECPTHTGYHSSEEYGISEILSEDEKPINSGVGRLISTDLWNYAHPFIRYDTQDLVEIEKDICSCKRHHLKIKRILGRDSDVLFINNRNFIVHDFTAFFSRKDLLCFGSVNQFQVINQKAVVIFRLVVNKIYNDAVATFIKEYWKERMQVPIEIQIVDQIPLTQSGKRRFILDAD